MAKTPRRIRRALISVYDKTGILDFARALHEAFGIEIISTGGTARLLKENGIPVTLVEEITGLPEMLDGRVKTLHPSIHAAILADRDNPEHMQQLAEHGIEPIDMVVVNLYPFEETVAKPDCTFDEAIEMIDIGGPCLLRAAAKNHKHVLVVAGPTWYSAALYALRHWSDDRTRREVSRRRACSAVIHTAAYDGEIAAWLSLDEESSKPSFRQVLLWGRRDVRYGENPHQAGEVHQCVNDPRQGTLSTLEADEHPQREMSFNNYVDASAALDLCLELSCGTARRGTVRCGTGLKPVECATLVTVFVKHTNACGVGIAEDAVESYRKTYLGDPKAAMGGILACNFNVTPEFAEAVMETYDQWGKDAGAGGFFIEVWLAPSFQNAAIEIIRSRKTWGQRVSLLEVGDLSKPPTADEMDFKRIAGGVLMQNRDIVGLNEDQWTVVTKRQPTDQELHDLRLAWLICKHTKSNAITICADGMLIGNGAGQMSRVMSCRIATWLANENGHADKLPGSVAASDGFFPFRDGPDMLMEAGVTALIQPGGSKRDAETIDACNQRGAAMIFTGTRHFRH